MKQPSSIEVLERMEQIVVTVRQQFGKDDVSQTLVLEEQQAVELCVRMLAVIKRRRAAAVEGEPAEKPPRWWKFYARAHERRGPREAYGLGKTESEAQANSPFAKLHAAEVTAIQMPEGFKP